MGGVLFISPNLYQFYLKYAIIYLVINNILSMTREQFLQDKHTLFWYIQDLNKLSDNSVVETILNYGDWQDFKDMISLFGLPKIAQIFQQDIQKTRNNYRPEIQNYFTLYFQKYAK